MLLSAKDRSIAILPGLALCAAVMAIAVVLEGAERLLFGRAWLESLVLAILLGAAIKTMWRPSEYFRAGIDFGAKFLLELAVVLLGLSVSATAVLATGPALFAGIALVVAVAMLSSYGIGRAVGLPHRMSLLVACGNSICGNAAIAATAPVIGAESADIAASIAFTAVLGIVVVLGLPLLVPVLGLSPMQYGVFAGLTVYAVPQVIAATAPVAALSVQIGTLVKLIRVLMLGPVVLGLALLSSGAKGRPTIHRLVPWFIIGFLLLVALRSADLVPQLAMQPAATLATLLTVLSMAALGLGVDMRVVARAGGRATGAVVLSLLALGAVSLALIHVLAIA
ncbi:conserved hypothetical integral membrane protein [Rhizobiales bacterium GAS191]|nr:conserved hypothetical integral membrane protein [Rhizobiales bacterium GAS113]SED98309.1 conserved hypothetical integral membrane protein [Rhizobiales bacterium GAS191]